MENVQFAELRAEVERLKARVDELERRVQPRPGTVSQWQMNPVPQTPAPPPVATAASETLEERIGGNWLNKIAAVALILGMAFFLKYAMDNRWINESARILIGLVAGLGLVYTGGYFHRRDMLVYGQGVVGAGIAILYFTLYAAFAFYRLIPQSLAFACMIVVTITAIANSVRYNAVAIAILGIIGAFLTPALLQGDGGGSGSSTTQVLAYIAILDLGILGITWCKNWRTLNLLSFFGTVLFLASALGDLDLSGQMIFLTLFFAIFAVQSFVQNVIARRPMNEADIFLALAAPILYFGASYSLLSREYYAYLGFFALVLGGLYLLFAQRVRLLDYNDRRLRLLFLGIATAFITAAMPIQLKHFWLVIGWTVEAVVLAWIGFYLNSPRSRYIAALLLTAASVYLLVISNKQVLHIIPILNSRFATFVLATASCVLIAGTYFRNREQIPEGERVLPTLLFVLANLLLIWAISLEVLDMIAMDQANYSMSISAKSIALSGVWAFYGILSLIAGIYWRYRTARLIGISLLGMVILKSFLYDVWTLERIYKIIAFLGLAVFLFVASYLYGTQRDKLRMLVAEGSGEDAQ